MRTTSLRPSALGDHPPDVPVRHENRLERSQQQLAYPKLLILDELGSFPLSREEASLFFRCWSAATNAAA